jgi:hypothetical protein
VLSSKINNIQRKDAKAPSRKVNGELRKILHKLQTLLNKSINVRMEVPLLMPRPGVLI